MLAKSIFLDILYFSVLNHNIIATDNRIATDGAGQTAD